MKYLNDSGLEYLIEYIKDSNVEVEFSDNRNYYIYFPNNLVCHIKNIYVEAMSGWTAISTSGIAYTSYNIELSTNIFGYIIGANISLQRTGTNIPIGSSVQIVDKDTLVCYFVKTNATVADVGATLVIWGVRPN